MDGRRVRALQCRQDSLSLHILIYICEVGSISCPVDQNSSALLPPSLRSKSATRYFDDLFHIALRDCRNERVNFSSMWPQANVSAIDLLDKMLVFDPTRRITVRLNVAVARLGAYMVWTAESCG